MIKRFSFALGAIIVIALLSWFGNIYKLTECDFKPDYRCEIVHGIGVLVPGVSVLSVWLFTDD